MSYLDLYHLQLEATPFAAKFNATLPQNRPAECILPTSIPSSPISPLALTLPALGCNFKIDTPLIPPPYFCTPVISGGVTIAISSSYNNPFSNPFTVTGMSGIDRVANTDCNYELTGDFQFGFPCIPKLQIISTVRVIDNNDSPVLTVDTNNFNVDHTDPCNPVLTNDFSLTMGSVCSKSELRIPSDPEISIDVLDADTSAVLGTLKISLGLSAADGHNACSQELSSDGSGSLSLSITPTFSCEADESNPLDFDTITLKTLHAKELLPPTDSCCSEVSSPGIRDCWRELFIGPDSSTYVQATAKDGHSKLEIGAGGKTIAIKTDDMTGSENTIKIKEIDVCVDGVKKKMMILASEPY